MEVNVLYGARIHLRKNKQIKKKLFSIKVGIKLAQIMTPSEEIKENQRLSWVLYEIIENIIDKMYIKGHMCVCSCVNVN